MNESFLHYIWQLQYFNKKDLMTTENERVQITYPGTANSNSGPDFSNAKLNVADIEWAGNVEIHTVSSAWTAHGHQHDSAYDNVILHVVWQDDAPVFRSDGSRMPTLELQHRVDLNLIHRYRQLADNPSSTPCEKSFGSVNRIIKISMLDKAMMQRLETKAMQVTQLFFQAGKDWEELTYRLLAKNFGFKINGDPFLALALALPQRILLKHSDSLLQTEALLFGQAGFLDYAMKDDYAKLLQREFHILSVKYSLEKDKLNFAVWKFMRMRPANFPTLRIAQFSALIHKNKNLFSRILDAKHIADVTAFFDVSLSAYWHHHYRFGRATTQFSSSIGSDSVENIMINSIAPLLVAYGKYKEDQQFVDRAIAFLQAIPAESNKITKSWKAMGMDAHSAFDSQALIELNNNFCLKRNCLSCAIGAALLKPGSE